MSKRSLQYNFELPETLLFFSIFISSVSLRLKWENCVKTGKLIFDSFFLKHFDKIKQTSVWAKIKHSLFSSFLKFRFYVKV